MASMHEVERLKREFTDKWVHVDAGSAELKRFVGLNGRIKTVNMNGRALVQFDGPVDIAWYDIDLAFLKIVEAPAPKAAPAEKHAAPAEKKPAATPAAKPTGGKSPLELAREQAAAKAAAAGGAKPAAAPSPAPTNAEGKPLSKIELARLQAGVKSAAAPSAAPPAPAPIAESAPAPAPAAPPQAAVPTVGPDGKPLSKIELARLQGAMKKS